MAIKISRGKLRDGFTILGIGKQARDVLHADYMKTLYLAALRNIDSVKGRALSIGRAINNSLSLKELFNLLEEISNITMIYTKLSVRERYQGVFVAGIAKTKRLLEWEPRVSARTGVGKTGEWLGAAV